MKLIIEQSESLLEMANIRGKDVKTDKLSFSFYFSRKDGNSHGIRVKLLFNPNTMRQDVDGYMELHGNYEFILSPNHKNISNKLINEARVFFKKYKVLFAGVWENALDSVDVEDYFKGRVTLKDVIQPVIEENNKILDVLYNIHTIAEFEHAVRKYKLFNMND